MQKGFAPLLLILIITVILTIVGGAFFLLKGNTNSLSQPKTKPQPIKATTKVKATPIPGSPAPSPIPESELYPVTELLADNIKYTFSLNQGPNQQGDKKGIVFETKTKQQFSNLCYSLDNKTSMSDSTLKVTYGKVNNPAPGTVCAQAIGSARFEDVFQIGQGTYTLLLIDEGKQDSYQLVYGLDTIEIKPITVTFTKSLIDKLVRFPQNILSVSCRFNQHWSMDPQDNNCQNLFSDIEKIAPLYIKPETGKKPNNLYYTYDGPIEPILDTFNKHQETGFFISGGRGKDSITCYSGGKCTATHFDDIPEYIDSKYAEYKIEYEKPLETSITNCYESDHFCIQQVAFTQKDETYCEYIPSESRDSCYEYVGIGKRDENICKTKILNCSSCLKECSEQISILTARK